MTPAYYVSAGKRNVKLNQRELSPERPAIAYGPYMEHGTRNRFVTVFATDDASAESILADYRSRVEQKAG